MSPSTTAFAPSPSSTAPSCSCSRARAGRWPATSPSSSFPEGRYVIDGELLILDDDGREVFDALQNRLHPAESRVKMLAEKTPALFRAFDRARGRRPERDREPVRERRAVLEELARRLRRPRLGRADTAGRASRPRPSPGSTGGEGVIAKRLDSPYLRRRAQGDGQDQAPAHDRRGDRRLAARARRRTRSAR